MWKVVILVKVFIWKKCKLMEHTFLLSCSKPKSNEQAESETKKCLMF